MKTKPPLRRRQYARHGNMRPWTEIPGVKHSHDGARLLQHMALAVRDGSSRLEGEGAAVVRPAPLFR